MKNSSVPYMLISLWRKFKYKFIWRVKHIEYDPEHPTFWGWLNQQDMHVGRWEYFKDDGAPEAHHHELVALTEEETEEVLARYLREREHHG
jgi:hypothetical protein